MKVLIVGENDLRLLDVSQKFLRNGAQVSFAKSGGQAIGLLRDAVFDVVILAWNLHDISGVEILRWTRSYLGASAVVAILFDARDGSDIINILNAGANECISNSASAEEVYARISVIYKKIKNNRIEDAVISIGRYVVNPASRSVSIDGRYVDLTAKEFALTLVLFKHFGMTVSRDLLIRCVWGRDIPADSKVMATHISAIRKKLFRDPDNGVALTPIYSHGYRLEWRRDRDALYG
ncbi:response regulator transcription factor [Burkholderia ambifaria]|uniref:response regulator transcription factor n=1 Tax=Burkholderia ambifaria TaxID=152480 RepID=UPI00158E6AD6|nr:response regulator transcription factor [Burkholderia ambifaria]